MPPPILMPSPVGASMAPPPTRRGSRAPALRRSFDPMWQQFAVMLAIILACDILARGSGIVARAFFMLAAIGACVYYIRKSPWLYLTMTLWLWSTTALVRRLIDYHAGFDPVNFILGTPEFVSLLTVWAIFNSRELMRHRETIIGLFITVPILYGIGVSFVQGQIISGIIGSADWIGPPLYYFFVIAHWRRIREFEPVLTKFLGINIAVISAYTIFQFVTAPPWDAAWLTNSAMTGMGSPEPFQMRIFGSLNASGILADWVGTALLLFLHFKNRITPLLVPICAMLVILSFARSAAGAVLAAYLVAALLGRGGIFKMLLIGTVGVVISLSVISVLLPQVNDMIVQRAQSVQDLDQDNSADVRQGIYANTPRLIAAAPFGLGIGAIGRGAVSQQNNSDLAIIDSGPLGVYLPLGWVAGTVYFTGIILMVVQAWSAARSTRSSAAIALTAAAVSQVCLLPFFNVLGITAMLLWLCSGYAASIGMEARINRRFATRPVDRIAITPARNDGRALE